MEEKGGILAVCKALEAFPGDVWLVSSACLLFLHIHDSARLPLLLISSCSQPCTDVILMDRCDSCLGETG